MTQDFIQQQWRIFMELCVNPEADADEIWSAKMFFFGGATAMWFLFNKELPKDMTVETFMAALDREVHAFKRESELKAIEYEQRGVNCGRR